MMRQRNQIQALLAVIFVVLSFKTALAQIAVERPALPNTFDPQSLETLQRLMGERGLPALQDNTFTTSPFSIDASEQRVLLNGSVPIDVETWVTTSAEQLLRLEPNDLQELKSLTDRLGTLNAIELDRFELLLRRGIGTPVVGPPGWNGPIGRADPIDTIVPDPPLLRTIEIGRAYPFTCQDQEPAKILPAMCTYLANSALFQEMCACD